jgi:hypothetical protein
MFFMIVSPKKWLSWFLPDLATDADGGIGSAGYTNRAMVRIANTN